MMDASTLERFLSKVAKHDDDQDGCWQWLGVPHGGGYASFTTAGLRRPAHRVSYEHFVAPIPTGLQIDHLCRNTLCVNPAHLEPVTASENARRGIRGILVTHCGKGHELTPENVYEYARSERTTRRYCRLCSLERSRAQRARRRAV